ncbi:MAG: hypothetical protein N2110_00805 [Flavobacteriales bacterium]|nr:hypothetical protein [Flavobacteriales bacterium]
MPLPKTFGIAIGSLYGLACVAQDFTQTYWYLRVRLREKFIFSGVGKGEGYAATALVQDRNQIIRYYGDNTAYHGWYLAVLASEYAWLKKWQRNVKATVADLYEALHAVHRLDSVAETYFQDSQGAHGLPQLNGFFIRDDVDQHVAHQHGWTGQLLSDYELGCSLHPGDRGLRDNEMSQDQAIHLLWGLRFVHHFVDDSVQAGGRLLREWARQMALRIIRHIAANRWIVTNPVTGRPVYRGHDARLLSKGFVKAAEKFVGDVPRRPVWYSYLLWPWLRTTLVPVYFNRVMVMILGAIGNAYGSPVTTRRFLCANGRLWKKEIYALAHELWEPQVMTRCPCTEKSHLAAMLRNVDSTAFRSYGAYGWTTTNRWLAPARTYGSYDGFFEHKEVTGLDYMLLHNLFILRYGKAEELGH